MLINVLDYATPADALAIARDGDSVYFPSWNAYTAPSGAGWNIGRCIEVYGDGPGVKDGTVGSIVKAANGSSQVFTIAPSARNLFIHDLQLQRGAVGSGTGAGIVATTLASSSLQDLRLRGLLVTGFLGDGVRLTGVNDGLGKVARVSITDCAFRGCGGVGLSLSNAFDVLVTGCSFDDNQKNGLAASGGTIGVYQCNFEANATLSSWSAAGNPTEGNLKLLNCLMSKVDACRFARINAGNVRKGLVVSGGVGVVGCCCFESDALAATFGISVLQSGTGPVAILSNRFKNVEKLISMAAGVRDCFITPQCEDTTTTGTIDLPQPNEGLFGSPSIVRAGAAASAIAGLVLPSSTTLPTQGLTPGMLAYVADPTNPAVVVRTATGWRKLVVT